MTKNIASVIGGKSSELFPIHYNLMKDRLNGEEKVVSQSAVMNSTDDDAVPPPRDPRALFYDACTEHYTYGESSLTWFL
jgi:hypothetical protein